MADQNDRNARRHRISRRVTRILSVTRWVSLVVLVGILGYHYGHPGAASLAQQSYVADRSIDSDDEALVERVARAAPQPSLYVNETAVKLVEMGRQLVDEPRYRAYVAKKLNELSVDPAAFGDDEATYLLLRMAYWQLRHDPELSGSAEAALLLWQAAEDIERVDRIQTADSRYGSLAR